MLNFRALEYQIDEPPETVFSRLTWETERVNNLWSQLIVSNTVSTKRMWVGVLDDKNLKFDLVEPRGFFSFKPLHVVVSGTISGSSNKSNIKIRLKPGWFTLYIFGGLYLATIFMLATLIINGNANDELLPTILWFVAFPGLGTYLLHRKFNKMESRIEDTLLLNRETKYDN